VFLILFGIVDVMKYIALALLFIFTTPATAHEGSLLWDPGMESFKNWPDSHWKSQNFEPTLQNQDRVLRSGINQSQSMFADIDGLNPTDFIQNLKNAKIIKGAFNKRTGFFDQTVLDEVIIELDENFYTLSYADQKLVTELLAKSYNQDSYLLKDSSTKNIVGQITPEGFHLF
jgi:hypothetical protein